MAKKGRKKKEEETETYDILHMDEKIKKNILEDKSKLNEYKNKIKIIYDTLQTPLTYSKKKELEKEKSFLEQKIRDIESNNIFAEYVCLTQKILSEYMKLLDIPMNISFFTKHKKDNEIERKKEDLVDQFLDIAKLYIPINTYKKEISTKLSCDCGNTSEFITNDTNVICENCGREHNIHTIHTNFKDIDRVNLSQKYKYSRHVYFRETVNRYEGKQNKKINKKVYDDLEKWFTKHNLLINNDTDKTFYERHLKISKEHVYMALSETGNNLHYEDINLLHNQFTGIPCPDVSEFRDDLFDDFNKVMNVYESIDVDRVNSLNSQYILYQLLRRRKIRVNENDFGMLKTRERLIEYDEIYQKICLVLEWTFIPTV